MGPDLEKFERQLIGSMSKDELPLLLIGFDGSSPVGTAALKLQELEDLYPDYQYWLGSVYVAEGFRGRGYGAQLSLEIVRIAKQRGLPGVYLQTSSLDGGLYAKLGWEPVQQFLSRREKTLLMQRKF
jgi:GNAT superfamily N-acetyltransferase